jgi:hypothetical protein
MAVLTAAGLSILGFGIFMAGLYIGRKVEKKKSGVKIRYYQRLLNCRARKAHPGAGTGS